MRCICAIRNFLGRQAALAAMLLALLASAAHAQMMLSQVERPRAAAPEVAMMACCDDISGTAHATPACAAFFAPGTFRIAQPALRPALVSAPPSGIDRHGLTWAPPRAPPRS